MDKNKVVKWLAEGPDGITLPDVFLSLDQLTVMKGDRAVFYFSKGFYVIKGYQIKVDSDGEVHQSTIIFELFTEF